MSTVGQIDLDLGFNYRAFNRALNSVAGTATNLVGGAFKKLGFIIAGAFAVNSLAGFAEEAINLASDLAEVQNVVDVTFGSMADHVNKFSQEALVNFGLSELSAKKYASTMGAMLKSSGLAGAGIVKMSEDLTGLSADMASFYNLSNDDAFQKIQSGISGETEPLKQLGINMSVANLEAYALAQGMGKAFAKMTQAEQVMLRYNYLLSVTADAQGDFARTSDGWANQTRMLNEQWKIFQGTMGQGFINILAPVVRFLNLVIVKLQIAAKYFVAFTQFITGAKNQVVDTATSTAVAVDDMGGSALGMGKDVKKAGKAVKGSLSNFDALNVIAQSTADSMGDVADGAGDVGGAAGGMDLGMPDMGAAPDITPEIDLSRFQPLLDMLNSVKLATMEVGNYLLTTFGPTIQTAINNVLPHFATFKSTLMNLFTGFSNLAEPFKQWLSGDLVPFIQKYIGVMSEVFAGLLESAGIVFKGIVDVAAPLITWFVTDGLPLLTSFGSGVMVVFQGIFNYAKTVFDLLWSDAIQPGLQLASDIILEVLGIIKGFWDKWGGDIVDGVTLAIENVTELFQQMWEVFLEPVVSYLLDTLTWLWDKHLSGLVETLLDVVGKLATGALDIYNKFIVPIVGYLVKTLGPTWANAFKGLISILGTVIAAVSDVAQGVLRSLGGIIDFIVGVFTGDWKKAWGGVKDIFGGIFDSIVGILKGAINLIIDGINFMIRQLNTIKFDIPEWVPVMGGKKFGFSVPEIPKLAKGGLASAPTLAMVGDNKNASVDPEVITPLSKLQDMLGSSNQAVVEALYAVLDAILGLNMSLEIDGEKITRVVRDGLRAEDSRMGKSAVTIGGVSLR